MSVIKFQNSIKVISKFQNEIEKQFQTNMARAI